jgi:hypothetical protein
MSMQHPALRALLGGSPPLSVPGRLFNCGTPLIAAAAEVMAEALIGNGGRR